VHHFQFLTVPVELAVMKSIFWFKVVWIAEMLVCLIVSESV
jgi:hypothetical protein